MKYIPIPEIDDVTDALNFETSDCRVVGACDIYITKAAGGDKKLYKNIETSLESQHEAALRLSASLSPPAAELAAEALNLSRSSPFGPLSQISSRRTFAYLIATLNASHPDFDFSQFLRPSDFRREKNLKKITDTVDTNLFAMRRRNIYGSSSSGGPGGRWMPETSDQPEDAPETPRRRGRGSNGSGSDDNGAQWGHRMWQAVDAEMDLADCIMYCYEPEVDPYHDEVDNEDEGLALWSLHYFFFNKAKKRVCYLYVRALSLADDATDYNDGDTSGGRTPRTPVPATVIGRTIDLSWARSEPSSAKRAKYWLGERAVGNVIGGWEDEDEDEEGIINDTDGGVAVDGEEEDEDAGNDTDVVTKGFLTDTSDLNSYDVSGASEPPSPELGRKPIVRGYKAQQKPDAKSDARPDGRQRQRKRAMRRGNRHDSADGRRNGPLTRSRSRGLDDDLIGPIEI